MPAFTSIAIGIGTAVSIGQAVDSSSKSSKARTEASKINNELKILEANRQNIIDPYANVKDLSSMIQNPFANLQVATQAAEMQARETDISLASTLDTLRATGSAAGGATALAQAAARSKQGISASIEQQEAANARMRAQGEQQMQQMKMQEAVRLQQADIAGKQFVFSAQEQREIQRLNRLAGLQAQQQQMALGYQANAASAMGSALGALSNLPQNR